MAIQDPLAYTFASNPSVSVDRAITGVPFEWRTYFRNFFTEYLGRSDHPVPFGGRQRELSALDLWLDDPEAPPYLLLSGKGGSGKSALLVRWFQQILSRHTLYSIFIPVSLRFGTNTASVALGALADELAEIHEIRTFLPLHQNTSTLLKLVVNQYLLKSLADGRTLLVILDGLDEASDWEAGETLFPLDPPPGLRIVVAARYHSRRSDTAAWLRHLGWDATGLAETLEVSALDADEIRDVLTQAEYQSGITLQSHDLVHELLRLSSGDPLLVQLYVAEILSQATDDHTLDVPALSGLEPSIDGFFRHWWARKERLWDRDSDWSSAAVHTIFSILAICDGPILREDILSVAPEDSGLTSWNLDAFVAVGARLIIGDGSEMGMVFCHPRFRHYYCDERMTKTEIALWHRRIADWGIRAIQRFEKTESCKGFPQYLARHFGHHLSVSFTCVSDLSDRLLTGTWKKITQTVTGAQLSFYADIDRVWQFCLSRGSSALGVLIRSAVFQSSMASVGHNLVPELLLGAVDTNLFSIQVAVSLARQLPDTRQSSRALLLLARREEGKEQHQIASLALDKALAVDYARSRIELLAELFPFLTSGDYSRAAENVLSTARMEDEDFERGKIIAQAIRGLKGNYLERAVTIIWQLLGSPESDDCAGLIAVAVPYMSADQRSVVRRTLLESQRLREDSQFVSDELAVMLPYLEEEERAKLLQQVLGTARSSEAVIPLVPHLSDSGRRQVLNWLLGNAERRESWSKVAALSDVIPLLDTIERSKAIQNALDTITLIPLAGKASAFKKLLPVLGEECADVAREALRITRLIEEARERRMALSDLLPFLPFPEKEGAVREAYALCEQLADGLDCLFKSVALFPFLQRSDQRRFSQRVLKEMIEIHGTLTVYATAQIIPWLPPEAKRHVVEECFDVARRQEGPEDIAGDLVEILPFLPPPERAGLVTEILELSEDFQNTDWRVYIIKSVWPWAGQRARSKVAHIGYEAAIVGDPDQIARHLAEIGPILDKSSRDELARAGFAAAQGEKKLRYRLHAMARVAPFLQPKERLVVSSAIAEELGQLEDPWEGLLVLTSLMHSLRGTQRAALMADCLDLANAIVREDIFHPDDVCIDAMEDLLGFLPDREARELSAKVIECGFFWRDVDHDEEPQSFPRQTIRKVPSNCLGHILSAATRKTYWKMNYRMPRAFGELGSRWNEIAVCRGQTEYELLSDTLRDLTVNHRKEFVVILGAFGPLIRRLGGPLSVRDAVESILDAVEVWR